MSDRPRHLVPGSLVGETYTVEGLVRLSEGRMFYLVNDDRPQMPLRRCNSCGDESSPREQTSCEQCGSPFVIHRYLMSMRWNDEAFEAYEAYVRLGVQHKAITPVVDIIRTNGVLFSVTPFDGDLLLIDEASPFSNEQILTLGQLLVGAVAKLQHLGVDLGPITPANVLVSPSGDLSLFDVTVNSVGSLTPEGKQGDVVSIAKLLRRFCSVESLGLTKMLDQVISSGVTTLEQLGRLIEKRFEVFSAEQHKTKHAALTDVGLIRQLNEDNWGWSWLSKRVSLYVVADGMGGHDGGEVASGLAVATICEQARERETGGPNGDDEIVTAFDAAFQTANNTIKDHADERGSDMGTTMVAMLAFEGGDAYFANVGDSRAYLLREDALYQVSRDHSLVAKMVERGRISASEARTHPHSNILLRTVGTERDIDIDIFKAQLQKGDRVLLCSDGLWGEVEDREISTILNTYNDPRIACRELVRASHHGGGKDNVTLLIVDQ